MQPRFGDGFLREYGLLLVLPLAVFFGQIWGQQELEQYLTSITCTNSYIFQPPAQNQGVGPILLPSANPDNYPRQARPIADIFSDVVYATRREVKIVWPPLTSKYLLLPSITRIPLTFRPLQLSFMIPSRPIEFFFESDDGYSVLEVDRHSLLYGEYISSGGKYTSLGFDWNLVVEVADVIWQAWRQQSSGTGRALQYVIFRGYLDPQNYGREYGASHARKERLATYKRWQRIDKTIETYAALCQANPPRPDFQQEGGVRYLPNPAVHQEPDSFLSLNAMAAERRLWSETINDYGPLSGIIQLLC